MAGQRLFDLHREDKAETGKEKTKRKGVRELNNLGCCINYEKSRDRNLENQRVGEGEENSGGIILF